LRIRKLRDKVCVNAREGGDIRLCDPDAEVVIVSLPTKQRNLESKPKNPTRVRNEIRRSKQKVPPRATINASTSRSPSRRSRLSLLMVIHIERLVGLWEGTDQSDGFVVTEFQRALPNPSRSGRENARLRLKRGLRRRQALRRRRKLDRLVRTKLPRMA